MDNHNAPSWTDTLPPDHTQCLGHAETWVVHFLRSSWDRLNSSDNADRKTHTVLLSAFNAAGKSGTKCAALGVTKEKAASTALASSKIRAAPTPLLPFNRIN
jgi:hypothetical protein